MLLLLPQRYIFSSKSQHTYDEEVDNNCCCCYHKGTYFQANHNYTFPSSEFDAVVVATTKVHIFKQITTELLQNPDGEMLLLLPQRYIFSSKSQLNYYKIQTERCCCCYHKGTYFQANHNNSNVGVDSLPVVVATTKVHIFKQITTDIPSIL